MKLVFIIAAVFTGAVKSQYTPDWDSLDSRPLPEWYDKAKIGIFLHWGVYSVPPYGSEWFWTNWGNESPNYVKFMDDNYAPEFTYQEFAPLFRAELYNPTEWATLFEEAGARYVVLTSKHHEGYTLWPSKYSWSWNSVDVGSHRDLVGELASAIRNVTPSIRFGVYHSLFEWYNRLYLEDKNNGFNTSDFVEFKTFPSLLELVNTYEPEIVWSDGEWEASDDYWKSKEFLAWLYNNSTVKDTVVANDRWGGGTLCKHGDFYTCADRYNPGVLQDHKWENCMSLDKRSWGYRGDSTAQDYLTIVEVLQTMMETVSCGGNLLVNAGPNSFGKIPPIMEERFRQMGEWLSINGEAVYESTPWDYQNDSDTSGVWYTQDNATDTVYASVFNWPPGNILTLGSVESTSETEVYMLGYTDPLQLVDVDEFQVEFPPMSEVSSRWVWVLKMTGVLPHAPEANPK